MARASIILTLCPSATNVSVPCLKDPTTGLTTTLSSSSNQSYNFSNLNISVLRDLPTDAQWVDLSYNQISNISRSMPSTLKFLNLSHNTLQKNWIQTPISATTLDVSNNQGGLRWMENVLWGVSLPKLTRLIFRTNNLKEISLSYDNFPLNPHPFSALDLSGNVNMNFSATADVFNYMNKIITFSADTNSYNDTLRACGNRTDYVVKLRSLPVQYSSQGEAQAWISVLSKEDSTKRRGTHASNDSIELHLLHA
ncbi:unnamed protein product [Aphanomyces euteiches]